MTAPANSPAHPPKPRPGDRVAVISPSAGLPGLFPHPYELGLRRLREEFGLEPVEYPSTRKLGATAEERAADIHAAFADPSIKAVLATIGGEDQITVLPYLDRELIRANAKPFFGYSDNTNLLLFLRNLGIVSYHGSSVMVQLGRGGALNPATADSLRAALLGSGPYELRPSAEVGDQESRWEKPELLADEPVMEPGEGWIWHNADRVVEGLGWGGNLEILAWMAMADREIGPAEQYAGQVLYLETSEEMPRADEVYRILRNLGERGLLRQFPALLMARAKSWSFEQPLEPAAKVEYRENQRAAVLRALAEYAPQTMAVFDVDFGHTDPQLILPCGGRIRVDGPERRITVWY
ncbi:S66 family peptidase [Kitasatospora kifunensis]|uniref:Muramoyltetrapeptide carboxypeptidase LdcA involved in peptidoglycan recycling n=1 Tax=Kitasatospora kifunensis TaxID=58351 RepID=A0A7W7R7W3_KITKI|nr:S66 peptidase family protein [Kitasatospora kifunensis]MBB4926501.1 muramoyltetrapeptide carboxypeptidase LdcA involved in peptidoglycan recycling [Kitasatospora kifunensis]